MTAPGRRSFDAVIIGAGPAGSAAAILLAAAGWSVALIERQHFPRRKVCGECVAASNLPLLQALGVGSAFDAAAGPALKQVRLLAGNQAVTAALPRGAQGAQPWGRALGRETLDLLLLAQARAAGACVFQPWTLQALRRTGGRWHAELHQAGSATPLSLQATLVIDAHGAWEALPFQRGLRQGRRSAADLLAFKANFRDAALPPGEISVLALDGGYGGMVVAEAGLATVACCLRRGRLAALRRQAPGLAAGDAVEALLRGGCSGVQHALAGGRRVGPWLASGPLAPGVRVGADDGLFRIGNAAGEAHPILGEGLSMALQSAALLCRQLLGEGTVPGAARQAVLHPLYAEAWRRSFAPRLRVAAAFAHLAMRPGTTALLMALARRWPALLTQGARWGSKVCDTRPLLHPGVGRGWGAG